MTSTQKEEKWAFYPHTVISEAAGFPTVQLSALDDQTELSLTNDVQDFCICYPSYSSLLDGTVTESPCLDGGFTVQVHHFPVLCTHMFYYDVNSSAFSFS